MISLNERALEYYKYLKKEMVSAKIYHKHFDITLRLLANLYVLYEQCEKDVSENGPTVTSSRGFKSSPDAILLNQVLSHIRGYSKDLGLMDPVVTPLKLVHKPSLSGILDSKNK